ncbi:aurora kinase B [Danio aesculapii]|uniref:aurora kinase B n=1 Tax=Danio aesculapii TaxID=1142201 RepID=UPI0024BFC5BC|nr:aurora kinase B [Danio aesculapii]
MLFTVLGVISLFLGERNINATVSGQDERLDRQEGLVTVPTVTNSDGREIGDWCEESTLHLEEQINVEEPSLEEPVDGQSEEQSLVEPDSVHGEEQSLVEPVKPDSVHGEDQSLVEPVSVHGEDQSLVEPDSVHGEEQSLVEPDSVHGEDQSPVEPVSVHGEEESLVEPDGVHGEEESLVEPVSVHGEEQSLVEPDSVHGEDQSLVEPVSVHGEDQSLVEPDSVHSEDQSLVEPVDSHSEDSASSFCIDNVLPNFFYAESSSSDDCSQEFYSAGFNCIRELTASSCSSFFSAESSCSYDDPPYVVFAEPSFRDDVAQGATCQTEDAVPPQPEVLKDSDTYIIEINSHRYEIGDQLGKGGFGTVFEGTRLQDGLQVAVKVVDFKEKRVIRVDDFDEPLPSEIALHFLANKGPKVYELVQLLDWKVEADRYIMVLERPIPCVSVREFLRGHHGSIPEDVLQKIMFHTTVAADTCSTRGVLHRDIKPDNLLMNPLTFEVKLIDFGCGDLLTDNYYRNYFGTMQFSPPEFKKAGYYFGEPATVWSLGILQYLLMFKTFPNNHDLLNLKTKDLQQYGRSKECSDFIRGCLEINFPLRPTLQALRVHDWFKVMNRF